MKSIKELQEKAFDDFSRTIRHLDKLKLDIEPILASLPECATVYAAPDDLTVSISGSYSDLKKALGCLRKRKFVPECRPEEKSAVWSTWLNRDADSARIFFSFSSTQCQRKQVGTKLVETPIYEVVCE